MTDGQEINKLKLEVKSLKQQLHTERVNFLKQHDKEIALVREDVQIEILRLEKRISELVKEKNIELTHSVKRINELLKISEDHQKINGELQEKLSQYEDKAAHYRRKAIL